MSSYPLIEYMVFDTDIYDGVTKMRAATLLGEIVRLHQHTKDPLKYVHKNSKYGNLFAIPASYTQAYFQDLEERKARLKELFSICKIERRKITWQWHNICQSIFSEI